MQGKVLESRTAQVISYENIFSGATVNDCALYFYCGSNWLCTEAVYRTQPSMTSYFKGGVESWRVARPGQGSGWGLGLVPQAPRSNGHTASAPGPSPDTDLWDRGITFKPAVRTTQMVAQDDSRTNTHRHTKLNILIQSYKHLLYMHLFTQTPK